MILFHVCERPKGPLRTKKIELYMHNKAVVQATLIIPQNSPWCYLMSLAACPLVWQITSISEKYSRRIQVLIVNSGARRKPETRQQADSSCKNYWTADGGLGRADWNRKDVLEDCDRSLNDVAGDMTLSQTGSQDTSVIGCGPSVPHPSSRMPVPP